MKDIIKKFIIHDFTYHEKKIITLAAVGGMLEFYDFVIYGIFSVYFAHQFFPSSSNLISIIESFSVFLLGFIARPIGGLYFSYLGDRHKKNRKQILIITMTLMGISSIGIGLLPVYNTIGIFAPLLMVFFRLIQGLALGGELPTSYVYLNETIVHKVGSGFGFIMVGIGCGLVLAMIINQIINTILTPKEIINFGWRLPFILGGIVCFLSYKIRKELQDTKEFEQITKKHKLPLVNLFKYDLKNFFISIGITGGMASLLGSAIIFMPTYLIKIVHITDFNINASLTIAMIIDMLTVYIVGCLINFIDFKKLFFFAIIIAFPMVAVSYYLISIKYFIYLAVIMLCIIHGFFTPLVPFVITKLFPTSIRLTGVAISYNIGFTIFAGFAPIFITHYVVLGFSPYITPIFFIYTSLILNLIAIMYLIE